MGEKTNEVHSFLVYELAKAWSGHFGEEQTAIDFVRWRVPNIVRPGEPWTAADVRAVLSEGGEGS